MTDQTKTIAESNNFIVLNKYTKCDQPDGGYQTEDDLERELLKDLQNQGYEFVPGLNSPETMLANVRVQLQILNEVQFTDAEWQRFVMEYLDNPSDNITDKARKIHDNHIYDFTFDDGHLQNIALLDKKNIPRNKVQVIKQFAQKAHKPIAMM